MRAVGLLIFVALGCGGPAPGSMPAGHARTAHVIAALIETAENNRQQGLDSARARAAADSVLRSEGFTREEFLGAVRSLNADVSGWREVSEEAARVVEQRTAERAGGR